MIFVSYAQLVKDVLAWSEKLHRNLDLIVGIPRSGMLPASILALHRNIALSDVDTFVSDNVCLSRWRSRLRTLSTHSR